MRIETKKGKQTLKSRLLEADSKGKCKVKSNKKCLNCSDQDCALYWVKVVEGALKEDLAMDEIDYENTPKEYRKLWRGLR